MPNNLPTQQRKGEMSEREEDIERLVDPRESEDETVVNLSLRPQMLDDFIGQRDVVEPMQVALTAAKQRGDTLEHVLLSGPPGLGKTTLAYIIGHELGVKVVSTSGPAITRAGDLVGTLTNLGTNDILFIDEIHRLNRTVEEFLYSAMEDFQIDFMVDKGPFAKTIKFTLKPFTLIGATTREGLLSAPMRGRFGLGLHYDFYRAEDLAEIVRRSAKKLEIELSDDAANEIAVRSRGTPRVANRMLRRVRDFAQVKGNGTIDLDIALKAATFLKVDALGLDELDRKYMRALRDVYKGGPAGVEAIAATLSEEVDTLVDVVEPFLLKIGFLQRTQRGRALTDVAVRHLEK
jgi:Holliday junction DNA helicase RuvB